MSFLLYITFLSYTRVLIGNPKARGSEGGLVLQVYVWTTSSIISKVLIPSITILLGVDKVDDQIFCFVLYGWLYGINRRVTMWCVSSVSLGRLCEPWYVVNTQLMVNQLWRAAVYKTATHTPSLYSHIRRSLLLWVIRYFLRLVASLNKPFNSFIF